MKNIAVGDEVMCQSRRIYARVEEVFPAAVCVKLVLLHTVPKAILEVEPQLWRADDIENLSVCRHCATREHLNLVCQTGIPYRICALCAQHILEEPAA